MTSGTTRDRSLIRQFRFAGMEKWHVLCIIGILPILLHLSLGIFLAGLIFFLVPRHLDLAYIIGSMTVIVYSLYFITNLVPLFDIQCPYRTPLTESINVVHHHFRTTILLSQAFFARGVNSTRAYLHRVVPCIQEGTPIVVEAPSLAYKSLRQREKDYVQSVPVIGSLSLDGIAWLMDASSNPSVRNVAVEAIGGLPPSQRERAASLIPACLNSIENLLNHFPHPPSRLERIARSTALLSRGAGHCLSGNKHYGILYTTFRDMDNLKGMVAALPLALRATEENMSLPERHRVTSDELFVLIDRLLRHSPDIQLSSYAWINLFMEVAHRKLTREIQLAIAAKALQGPGWESSTPNDPTSPVSVSVAFFNTPDLLLSIFDEYNPFKNPRPSGSFGLVQPPDSPHLCALLILHQFIIGTISQWPDTADIHSISLLESVWKTVSHIAENPTFGTSVNDCSAIFQATSICLVETGRCRASEPLCKYFQSLLQSCQAAFLYADAKFGRHTVRSWKWQCLDQVANTVFYSEGGSISMHACLFWQGILECDVQEAYATFVRADVLTYRVPGPSGEILSLVRAFVYGLARLRRRSEFDITPYLAYLHRTENLFVTCKIFAEHRFSTREDFLVLAQLQPDSMAWDSCRSKLRTWQLHGDNARQNIEIALDALDDYIEVCSILDTTFVL